MIDFEKLKPDSTGKYSPLLYKWLTSKKRVWFDYQHVFQMHDRIECNGKWTDHWRAREIVFGHLDFDESGRIEGGGGRTLSSIICGDRTASNFWYGAAFGLRDITAEFWAAYQRIGRCAWDHSHTLHMIGDENRWQYIAGGRKRECQWCGRVFESERQVIVEQPKVREVWSEYRASEPATLLYPIGSMGEEC